MSWPHAICYVVSAGSSYYDNVRPLAYTDSDAVLICFDISRPETLDSVIKKVSVLLLSFNILHQHLISAAIRQNAAENSFVCFFFSWTASQISVAAAFHSSTQRKSAQRLRPPNPLFHQIVHRYLTHVPGRNLRSARRMKGEALHPSGANWNVRYAN